MFVLTPIHWIRPDRWHHNAVSADLSHRSVSSPITAADIDVAAARIADFAQQTPLDFSDRLSAATGAGCTSSEDLQSVRSCQAPRRLQPAQTTQRGRVARRVVCSSAGNHAQGSHWPVGP